LNKLFLFSYFIKIQLYLYLNIFSQINDTIQAFFASIVRGATAFKSVAFALVVALIALFVISVKLVMPTVGQELMPPMDTGAIAIKITTDANLPIEKTQEVMEKINNLMYRKGGEKLLRVSGSIGSEAGVMSIGSGSGVDHILIMATYVNRHEREETIWDISNYLRAEIAEIAKIPHVKYLDVAPSGSTAMASIRASVDTMLSSPDYKLLQKEGTKVEEAMNQTKGIVSVLKTWDMDKVVYNLDIDEVEAMNYGVNRSDVTAQIQMMLRGVPVATFPKENSMDYTVIVWLPQNQIDDFSTILNTLIVTPKGKIPLSKIAKLDSNKEPSTITRDGLNYTLEIYGNREKGAISHIMANLEEQLAKIEINLQVEIEQIGEQKQFKASAERMIGAIIVAVFLILFTLIGMFHSVKISLMILFSIPLTIIGASWTMLAIGYHVSMPAMMGFMLLSGIIVNNAILLIHFALEQIKLGMNRRDAMLESIKIRTRPVLMTAFAVSVGMLPVAQGLAIGLERLAPLGAVAIGGLVVGTLMTLIFIPVGFVWLVDERGVIEED